MRGSLVLSFGHRFGSLCVLDLVPHEAPSDHQMSILTDLGKAVVAALKAFAANPGGSYESTEGAKSDFYHAYRP